jgi:hypothetical protein
LNFSIHHDCQYEFWSNKTGEIFIKKDIFFTIVENAFQTRQKLDPIFEIIFEYFDRFKLQHKDQKWVSNGSLINIEEFSN